MKINRNCVKFGKYLLFFVDFANNIYCGGGGGEKRKKIFLKNFVFKVFVKKNVLYINK